MHLIGSQMYLEHCRPILNHDIALTIAIKGNWHRYITIYFPKHLITIYINAWI